MVFIFLAYFTLYNGLQFHPKETKDLYIENYKSLMKEIKEDTNKMEKYTVFMDWNNQHCQNGHTTQSNLQIQCNPYQATNGIFHRTRTNNFTTVWKYKKPCIFESALMRWIKLELIIQSEVRQKDKDHYNILTHIYGI